MSEIRANTISAANGTDPVTLTKQSAAKVYCQFQGINTAAINGSLGVSSLEDRATGKYTLNYTSSFADDNYSIGSHIRDGAGENDVYVIGTSNDSGTMTTDLLKVYAGYHNASQSGAIVNNDPNEGMCIIHGDLA